MNIFFREIFEIFHLNLKAKVLIYGILQGTIKSRGSVRRNLYKEWASFAKILKLQPLDAVRDYYGVKIALYFAWLGFYTTLLVPPALAGLLVFIYGLATWDQDLPRYDGKH